mmetsp:Transcript_116520/g.276987  ORF Transcript_116520/g.276987 Transcript_116520/m.276987 type:complete len:226 (+) Transcript_116520:61-738(+)
MNSSLPSSRNFSLILKRLSWNSFSRASVSGAHRRSVASLRKSSGTSLGLLVCRSCESPSTGWNPATTSSSLSSSMLGTLRRLSVATSKSGGKSQKSCLGSICGSPRPGGAVTSQKTALGSMSKSPGEMRGTSGSTCALSVHRLMTGRSAAGLRSENGKNCADSGVQPSSGGAGGMSSGGGGFSLGGGGTCADAVCARCSWAGGALASGGARLFIGGAFTGGRAAA